MFPRRGVASNSIPMLVLALLITACGLFAGTEPASFSQNAEQRAEWEDNNVDSYHTVVEVERLNERRRADVVVRDGTLTSATMQYWDDQADDWDAPQPLNDEQGKPYTVPGLFEMVGGQLSAQQRSVSVHYHDTYDFPDRIDLGDVHDPDGRTIPNTDVHVRLVTFEPLR